MFAVSGDITKEEAVKIFSRYFGDWKAKNISVRYSFASSKTEDRDLLHR